MAILSHEYWKKFIEKDKNGKEKGNGREFEKLVRYLLYLMYGKNGERQEGVMIIIETFGCIYRIKIYGLNAKIIQIQFQ